MAKLMTTTFVPPQDALIALAKIRDLLMTCDPRDTSMIHDCLLEVVAFLQESIVSQEVR